MNQDGINTMLGKKIIFIASYPDSLLNFRLDLMRAFMEKGYEVIAIAPEDAAVKKALSQQGIRFISIHMNRTGTNPFHDLKLLLELKKIFQHEKPTMILSYTIKPVIYASLAAVWAGVPHIYALITGTGYAFSRQGLKSKIIGALVQYLFRKALKGNDTIFFQNKDNLAMFQSAGLLQKHQKTVLVNGSGVNCEMFSPVAYPGKCSFLMIARLLHDKGVVEYAQAAAEIRKIYPQVKFKLVGWIDSNPHAIKAERLQHWVDLGHIEYLGKLSDVRPAIAKSSVYVLPSYHEGTPRSVLEAMAMARPIITTDAPGCRETVIPGENGFLVPIKNVAALVEKMRYFIENKDQIQTMGKVSRHLAETKFDVHLVNQVMVDVMLDR